MIAVVDYCKGNLKSVERGLECVSGNAIITSDVAEIATADAIVLPGVGAFSDAADTMTELGQMSIIKQKVEEGVPFLGICLGMHLMFEEGQEHSEDKPSCGLGFMSGMATKIPSQDSKGERYKVPHVGWNSVQFTAGDECPLFERIPLGEYFYFTHSFIAPQSAYTKAVTTHSVTFPSAVQYGEKAFGVQFHPEKSSDAGLRVLHNFVQLI